LSERQFPAVQDRSEAYGYPCIIHFWKEEEGAPYARYRERNVSKFLIDDRIIDISTLRADQRTVFVLQEVLGLQQKNIGRLLGISTLTVGSLMERARINLGLRYGRG
jgi:DNA-directed RNA polymerase specialized sigma24 family protein